MISKVVKYFFGIWILFTKQMCFQALKVEKMIEKAAFVSYIESDSCKVAFWEVLSKPSKGRYLDLKRASFTSQKGVNWKPIYALFICSLRILFTKPHILTGTIEDLKDRSMWKSIVLLLLCLSFLQLTSNSLTRYLVYQIIVLLLLCLLITLSTINSLTCHLVNLSTKESFSCYFVFQLPCLQATR